MNARTLHLLCLLAVASITAHRMSAASDEVSSGITQQKHGDSTFTFRDGKLVHELSMLGKNWIEVFYADSTRVLVRAGYFKEDGPPIVVSERFQSEAGVTLRQVSRSGENHPIRVYVGGEIYNKNAQGFFEIMPHPEDTLRESIIMGPEFSTKELEIIRKSCLEEASNE